MITSVKSSIGIITHQSHISQVNANVQWVTESVTLITSRASCDAKNTKYNNQTIDNKATISMSWQAGKHSSFYLNCSQLTVGEGPGVRHPFILPWKRLYPRNPRRKLAIWEATSADARPPEKFLYRWWLGESKSRGPTGCWTTCLPILWQELDTLPEVRHQVVFGSSWIKWTYEIEHPMCCAKPLWWLWCTIGIWLILAR